MNIRFSPPDITESEIAEVVDTLKSGWITTGPKTKRFESEIAAYCGTKRAVCLNSQTACAELTLRLLGIGPGDEVITSAYTYTASASVIIHVGATPVLVDTAPDSFEMDYTQLKAAFTSRTKAVIPVDIAGIPCDYDRIFEIVKEQQFLFEPKNELQRAFGRVPVVADAAHSFGATYKGRVIGSIADFTTFSFHAVKNLTTGEGGTVTWCAPQGIDDEVLYKQYMLLSLHGQSKDALAKEQLGAWEYDIIEPYFKCNMTDIMASLGIAQLARYAGILARRHEIIRRYNAAFTPLGVWTPTHAQRDTVGSGHLYLARLPDANEADRNRVIVAMAERGVACNVHYKPLPLLSAYNKRGFDICNYPNAYQMYQNEISLPLHTLLTDEEVDYVIACLQDVLAKE